MLQREIRVATRPIKGTINIPGSKSISNRALLLAALREGETILRRALKSDDTEACIEALKALGIQVKAIDTETVVIEKTKPFITGASINCRESGTLTRFIIPILAAVGGEYHLYGAKRLSERPLKPLLDALVAQGVRIEYLSQAGCLPIRLHSRGLCGGEVKVESQDSSQFVSGLMLAAPLAAKPLLIRAPAVENNPYVRMTRSMMETFTSPYQIEPDASTASYFFAAAALTEGDIFIPHLSRTMLQGDIRFLAVLEKMGCTVMEKSGGIFLKGPVELKGLGHIDMRDFSDTFMTLAALAPFTDQATTITGLSHTRLQESDRVAAMAEGLTRLGAKVETTEDAITIHPGPLHGGMIDSHNDHRIAMSHALIGLKVPRVIIEDADCVKKTCPHFFEMLESLY